MAEIMCTLTAGQIVENEHLVRAMLDAGMRSVRINTAHLDNVDQLGILALRFKQLLPDIRILIDTKGPELRTTATAEDATLTLTEGEHVRIEGDDGSRLSTPGHIYVNYPDLHKAVTIGDTLLIDDGHISLIIEEIDGHIIKARVLVGGILGSKKGMSVAGKYIDLPSVSDRDRMFINYAASSPLIDEIAHSFVRCAQDVRDVKAAMGNGRKPLIAKIENRQGIDNLAEIIPEADGMLIARGDLTAEIGREAVPEAQAMIAAATKASGKPLYLATNILPSLIEGDEVSPADIEGIHIAINQGVDVMLLTNETAVGEHPLQSVRTLSESIRG